MAMHRQTRLPTLLLWLRLYVQLRMHICVFLIEWGFIVAVLKLNTYIVNHQQLYYVLSVLEPIIFSKAAMGMRIHRVEM